MKRFACLLFAVCFFCCNQQNEGELIDCDCDLPVSPYYITVYHLATDSVTGKVYKGDTVALVLRVMLEGEKLKDTDSELYRELAERFGDTGFNLPLQFGGATYDIDIMVDTLSSISITCDKDYDAGHPAGKPLDDLIFIEYKSARKDMDLFYNEGIVRSEKFEVEELALFNGTPHPLLGAVFRFYFKTAPALKETFSLTATGFSGEDVLFRRTFGNIDPENLGTPLRPQLF
jgi:hypothetical protein